jgi:hypothetical protein
MTCSSGWVGIIDRWGMNAKAGAGITAEQQMQLSQLFDAKSWSWCCEVRLQFESPRKSHVAISTAENSKRNSTTKRNVLERRFTCLLPVIPRAISFNILQDSFPPAYLDLLIEPLTILPAPRASPRFNAMRVISIQTSARVGPVDSKRERIDGHKTGDLWVLTLVEWAATWKLSRNGVRGLEGDFGGVRCCTSTSRPY